MLVRLHDSGEFTEAFAKAGKRDDAVRAYRRAIELDANNLNAHTMLRQLTNATRK